MGRIVPGAALSLQCVGSGTGPDQGNISGRENGGYPGVTEPFGGARPRQYGTLYRRALAGTPRPGRAG